MWILVGGVSLVFAIAALTMLALWAMSDADHHRGDDDDGEEETIW